MVTSSVRGPPSIGQPRSVAAITTPGIAEILPDGEECRREAKEQRGQQRHGNGKEKYLPVQTDVGFAGNLQRGVQRLGGLQPPVGEETARKTPDGAKNETLQEQLADQTAAASSKRAAQGNFFCTCAVVREQEACDVARRDEEQKRDRANQKEHGLLKIANDGVAEATSVDMEFLRIIVFMQRHKTLRDREQVGVRCVPADAFFENSIGEEKVRLVVRHGFGHGGFGPVPGN